MSKNNEKGMSGTWTFNGVDVAITVHPVVTSFGTVYVATNNYGEPKQNFVEFATAVEALENEKNELAKMLA